MRSGTLGTLVLAAGILVLGLVGGASGRAASNTWAGTWQTSEGKMVIQANGSGTYEHCKGTIKGTVRGDKLIGTWSQPWPGCNAAEGTGTFVFNMREDGTSFFGEWKYSTKPGSGAWNGTCTAGACMGNGAAGAGGPIYLRLSQPGGTPFKLSLPVSWTYTATGGGYVKHYFLLASDDPAGHGRQFPRGYQLEMFYRDQGAWKRFYSVSTAFTPWHFGYSCPQETKIWRVALCHHTGGAEVRVAWSNTVRVTCRFVKK